jgi:urease accessory protein UreF
LLLKFKRMQRAEPNMTEGGVAILGDLHPLLDQLGSTEGLVTLAAAAGSLRVPEVTSVESLVGFLAAYKKQLLLGLELPSIQKAYRHACGNETRELIGLDQEMARLSIPAHFADASRRIGQGQLQRLRPLRYERLVQRYLLAVEDARANGWHTLVYGITLALYSVPVRQGLLNYARQVLYGFVHAAAKALRLTEQFCRQLVEGLCEDIPEQLEVLLRASGPPGYHSV